MRGFIISNVLAIAVAVPFILPAKGAAQDWHYNPSRVTSPQMFMPYTNIPYTYPYYGYLPNRQPVYQFTPNPAYFTPGYPTNYVPSYVPSYPNYGLYNPAPNYIYVR